MAYSRARRLAQLLGSDGTVVAGKIPADAIDGTKIADDAIDSEHYTDGSVDLAHITGGLIQLSSESFADNDTSLMTSAAIQDKILSYGYSTTVGDITSVVAGTGLSGGGTSGDVTLNVDAAQSGITSLGTLTALTVDDITIDSSSITDQGAITIAGETITLRTDSSSWADALTIDASHNSVFAGNVTVTGNLQIDGTTTTVNSTTLTVDDKNIELGSVASPSDTTADGGGITLKGASDKTILWTNSTDSWDFNQSIKVNGAINSGADTTLARFARAGDAVSASVIYADATTDMEFGTTTSHGLSIITGDTRRLTIASGGAVTIPGTLGVTGVISPTTHIDMPDSAIIKIGTGDDLQIYHDTSNSHIKTVSGSVGDLYIASEGTNHDLYLRADDDIFIQPQGGENGITLVGNGAVTLYHDASAKLATLADGVAITGKLTTSSGTSSIYNRLTITDGTNQLNIGQWDGSNHRLEFDSNRPTLITSYNSNGIKLGISGSTTLTVKSNQTHSLYPILEGGATAAAGVGGTMADVNGAEVGPGYLNLGRDDTADAAQIKFSKNGASHSYIETRTNGLGFITDVGDFAFEGGKVGIGTTAPDANLSITDSTINSKDVLYLKSGADNVGDYLGIAWEIGIGGNGPHGAIRVYGGPSANDSYMALLTTTDGGTLTQGLIQDHNANLGLGTTGPNESFHISKSGDASIRLQRTAVDQQLRIDQNSIRTTSNSDITIFTNGNSQQIMLDQGTGFVGIGMDPNGYGKLSVNGTGVLLALRASSGGSRLGFYEGGTGRFYLDSLNGSDGLKFMDADGSSERMRIHEDGNVSIGTTAVQAAKFHIAHNKGSAGNLWTQVGPNNNMSAYIQNTSTTDNTNACLYFGNDSGPTAAINARFVNHSTEETELRFSTHDGSNPRERMYMTGAGKLGVGINPKDRNAGHFYVQSTQDNGGTVIRNTTMQQYKDVYSTHTGSSTLRYWHIKTNFKCSNSIMFIARVRGYEYGNSGHIVHVERSGYAYSGGSVINSQTNNQGSSSGTLDTYIADDDYVVFKYTGGSSSSYYNGYTFDIEMYSPTGYNYDFKVLAQNLNATSGDYY